MWGSAILALRQKVTAESWEVMRRLQIQNQTPGSTFIGAKLLQWCLPPQSRTWYLRLWNMESKSYFRRAGIWSYFPAGGCPPPDLRGDQYTLNNTCPPILSQVCAQACSKNRRRPWKTRSSCHETQKIDNQAVKIHFYMENVVNLKPNETTGSCGIWSLLLSFRTCATTWQSSRLDHLFPRKQRLPSLETKPRHVAIVRLSRTHCPVSGWKPWRRVSAPGSGAGSRTWLAVLSKSSKKVHVTKNS